jgi:hypothetical protein
MKLSGGQARSQRTRNSIVSTDRGPGRAGGVGVGEVAADFEEEVAKGNSVNDIHPPVVAAVGEVQRVEVNVWAVAVFQLWGVGGGCELSLSCEPQGLRPLGAAVLRCVPSCSPLIPPPPHHAGRQLCSHTSHAHRRDQQLRQPHGIFVTKVVKCRRSQTGRVRSSSRWAN